MTSPACRICGSVVEEVVDLGRTPPANWLLDVPNPDQERYPLALDRCRTCANLQLRFCLEADVLYGHYYYVTPASTSLERHYRWLIDVLMTRGYANENAHVVEMGSNRGAFLAAIAPHVATTLGVDPAANVVELARDAGVETVCDYFDRDSALRIARSHGLATTLVARHCMAHNAWPQRMLEGAAELLSPDGVLVIENNYAGQMIRDVEFDQIYHEHMFYYSVASLSELLRRNGFRMIDVELAPVHGGSIVCFAVKERSQRALQERVGHALETERPLLSTASLDRFSSRAYAIRDELRTTMARLRNDGGRIAAYGATAKGATLLNFCGLTDAEVYACADSTPIKEGRYIPGTGIPIVSERAMLAAPPDFFLLTAWNYEDELIAKTRAAGAADVRFIVPIPEVRIV